MKNRDKALRRPTIRRLRIDVTASSNVRSGCSVISANNQRSCFSNGETLPPLGFAAELPSSLQRRSQLITELGLTSRSAATSCREAICSSRRGRTSLPLFVLTLLWLLVYSQEKLPNVGSLVASDVLAPRGSFGVAQ
jgi:hypothetical protein